VSSVVDAFSHGIKVFSKTLRIITQERFEVHNITDLVKGLPKLAGITHGIVTIHSLHTTTAIFLNEFQQALLDDIKETLRALVADDGAYRHNNPDFSDCTRQNAASHLRAMLLGHNVSIPVEDGKLVLGRWQSIIFAELDGPQERQIHAQVIGV